MVYSYFIAILLSVQSVMNHAQSVSFVSCCRKLCTYFYNVGIALQSLIQALKTNVWKHFSMSGLAPSLARFRNLYIRFRHAGEGMQNSQWASILFKAINLTQRNFRTSEHAFSNISDHSMQVVPLNAVGWISKFWSLQDPIAQGFWLLLYYKT